MWKRLIKFFGNKAFTLIELIAVIAILSIVVFLTINSITKSFDRAKEQAYHQMVENIENMTRLYISNYRGEIPNIGEVGTETDIELGDLVQKGIVQEPIIDPLTDFNIPLTEKIYIYVLGHNQYDIYFNYRGEEREPRFDKPIITLLGDNPMTLTVSEAYVDPGATAEDKSGNGINENSWNISSNINANVPGTYTVTYNVKDNTGNSALPVIRTVYILDVDAPTVSFSVNGNTTYAKNRSSTVTVTDAHSGVNAGSLKYQWTTSTSAPSEGSFSLSFSNGQSISSPSGVTGNYYLWILAKDNFGNTTIKSSNVFRLDNTKPVISLFGSNPVTIEVGTSYIDAGAAASDAHSGINVSTWNITSNVNINVAGTYTVTYTVNDNAGNTANTVTRTVIVEITGIPVITLLGVTPLTIEIGSVYNDLGATAYSEYYGNITSAIVSTGVVNPNVLGTYTITYNVSDPANNNATPVTRTVHVVDITPPTVSFSPNGNTTYAKNRSSAVTVTDAHSGVNTGSLRYQWTTSTSAPSEGTFSLSFTNGQSISSPGGVTGNRYLWILAKDNSGNTRIAGSNVFRLDNTNPVITLSGSNPVTIEVGSSYTDASATASDAHSGINVSSWNTTSTVTPNVVGTYTVTYNVNDNAGNPAAAVTRTVHVVDTTAPTVSFNPNGNTTYEKNHSTAVTVTDAHSGVNTGSLRYQWTTSTSAPSEGTFSLSFTNGQSINTPSGITGNRYLWILAKDNSGNTRIAGSNVFRLDNTNPVITLSGVNPVTIEVGSSYTDAGATASDAHSGINENSWEYPSTVNPNVVGTYTVTYKVDDNAGNPAAPVTRTVHVVDTTAPTVSFSVNGNTTYAKNHSTAVTVTDAHSGVNTGSLRYQWTTSTSAPSEGTFSLSFTNGQSISTPGGVTGNRYLWILAKDNSGNTTIAGSNVFRLDNTNPVITILGSNPVTIEAGSSYTDAGATASDAHSGINVSSWDITSNVNTNVVGTYTVTYNVNDNAGNIANTVTRTVHVETTGIPVITVLGDNPLTIEIGSVYNDPGATASSAYYGDLTSAIVSTGIVNPNVLGTYTITYNVSDPSLNAATPKSRTVHVVDTTAPTVTFNPNGNTTYAKSRSSAVTVTDAHSGVNTGSLRYQWTSSTSAPSEGTFSLSFTNGQSISSPGGVTGNRYLWILAKDNSGNTRIAGSNVFRLDNTNPVITLSGSNPVTIEVGSSYTDAGATASDAHSGINVSSWDITSNVNTNVVGTYTVTYNVNDNAGNIANTVTRTVHVVDTTPPTTPTLTLNESWTNTSRSFTISGGSDLHSGLAGYQYRTRTREAVGGSWSAWSSWTLQPLIMDYTIWQAGQTGIIGPFSTYSLRNERVTGVDPWNNNTVVWQGVSLEGSTAGTGIYFSTSTPIDNTKMYRMTWWERRVTNSTATTARYYAGLNGYGSTNGVYNRNTGALSTNPYFWSTSNIPTAAQLPVGQWVLVVGHVWSAGSGTGSNHPDSGTYTVNGRLGNISTDWVWHETTTTGRSRTIMIYVPDAGGVTHQSVYPRMDIVDGTEPSIAELLSGFDPKKDLYNGSAIVVRDKTGETEVQARSVDNAENVSSPTSSRTARVDKIPPVITISGANPITIEVGSSYNDAGATASDAHSGINVSSWNITSNVNTNVVGTYTVTYNVNDNAGNSASTVTRTVHIVNTGIPVITVLGDNPLTIEVGSVYNDPGATASSAYYGNLTSAIVSTGVVNPNVLGTYTITYNVSDPDLNAAIPVTRTVHVVDTTAPTVSFSVNGNPTYAKNHSTAVTVTDAHSGVNTGSLRYQWTTSTSAPSEGTFSLIFTNGQSISTPGGVTGNRYLWILAKDNSGNTTIAGSNVFRLDNTNPVITLSGVNPVTIEVGSSYTDAGATASDAHSGINENSWEYPSTVNPNVVGTYTVTYKVDDNAGNPAAPVTRTVHVVDTTAPTVSFSVNGNPTYAKNHSTAVTVTDAHSGVNTGSLRYQWTTSTSAPSEGTFSLIFTNGQSISTPGGVTGNRYLWILAKDNSGNTTIAGSNVFRLDNTKPVITLSGSNPVTIEVGSSYTDAGATASDGHSGINVSSWDITSNVNTNVVGTYTVTYNVNDNAGNTANTVTRTVHVETTGIPVITVLPPNPLTIEIGSVYNDPGATAYSDYYGNLTGDIVSTGVVNPNVLGTYTITYNVSDPSLNAATPKSRTVHVVDTTAPTVTFNPNGNTTYAKNHSSAVTVTDAHSGVNTGSLRYQWTSSTSAPSEGTFSLSFTNGQSISTPSGITGNRYLWILAKDNSGNTRIAGSNVFRLDNTKPVITISGSNPVTIDVGSSYNDAGATASDAHSGINVSSWNTTSNVNTNVAGTYTVTYNVNDNAGNTANTVTRTVIVEDVGPSWPASGYVYNLGEHEEMWIELDPAVAYGEDWEDIVQYLMAGNIDGGKQSKEQDHLRLSYENPYDFGSRAYLTTNKIEFGNYNTINASVRMLDMFGYTTPGSYIFPPFDISQITGEYYLIIYSQIMVDENTFEPFGEIGILALDSLSLGAMENSPIEFYFSLSYQDLQNFPNFEFSLYQMRFDGPLEPFVAAPTFNVEPTGTATFKNIGIDFKQTNYINEVSQDGGNNWFIISDIYVEAAVDQNVTLIARIRDGSNILASNVLNITQIVDWPDVAGVLYNEGLYGSMWVPVKISPFYKDLWLDFYYNSLNLSNGGTQSQPTDNYLQISFDNPNDFGFRKFKSNSPFNIGTYDLYIEADFGGWGNDIIQLDTGNLIAYEDYYIYIQVMLDEYGINIQIMASLTDDISGMLFGEILLDEYIPSSDFGYLNYLELTIDNIWLE